MPFEPLTASAGTGARDAPGWFGKLSMLGDFAHRRLPAEFVQASDAWLSRAMLASREQLAERWLDIYLTAPLMRFAWAPGIADAHWWFGVLMPSCDNVGRYFPLLIAQRRTRPPLDRIALDHLEAWFDHLANAATLTLGEHETTERFEQALETAPPWPSPPSLPSLQGAAGGDRYALGPRVSIGQWLHAVAADEMQARLKGCSIWWQQRHATQDACATVVHGLPEPETFAAMLSGC